MRPEGDAPLCDCHGEPMLWHTDARKPKGGWWFCAVKERERDRRRDTARYAKRAEYMREKTRRWRAANSDRWLRIRDGDGVIVTHLLPRPEDKQRLQQMIAEFRAQQQAEYRELTKEATPDGIH